MSEAQNTISEGQKEELKNALESKITTPTYMDLSESHHNDDMFALKKNVLRVQWEPTMQPAATALDGQVQWNNIQPPSKQCGISKMFIKCIFDITFTNSDAQINTCFDKDHLFMYDINAALYNTEISMTGQSLTGQPYIDLAIKRLYDPDFYTSSLINKSNDKNVFWTSTLDTVNNVATIHYECSSPLIHPFFSSENDIAGVNAFTINTRYNLTHLFNQYKDMTAATTAARTSTAALTNLKWSICYDQINYDKPLNDYMTLLMWEAYFTEKQVSTGGANENSAFRNNVRDIPSTPICQYALAIRDINERLFTSVANSITVANGSRHIDALTIPHYRVNRLDITVNSNSNAYNTNSFMDIVHCCRRAGFQGDTEELTQISTKYPPVYGFSSLEYRNVVGSADTYRFNVSDSEVYYDGVANALVPYRVYYVMMQPALFISSDSGSAFVNNMGVPFSGLIKSDSDIDAYIKLLEQSGYSGGSLISWLKGLKEKLKKGRYISNAGKLLSNLMDSPLVKQGVSMIPVVGPAAITHWDKAKEVVSDATKKAYDAGYGVTMF